MPELGRFISEDLVKGFQTHPFTLNPYSYCWSQPLNLVDLDGLAPVAIADNGGGGSLNRRETARRRRTRPTTPCPTLGPAPVPIADGGGIGETSRFVCNEWYCYVSGGPTLRESLQGPFPNTTNIREVELFNGLDTLYCDWKWDPNCPYQGLCALLTLEFTMDINIGGANAIYQWRVGHTDATTVTRSLTAIGFVLDVFAEVVCKEEPFWDSVVHATGRSLSSIGGAAVGGLIGMAFLGVPGAIWGAFIGGALAPRAYNLMGCGNTNLSHSYTDEILNSVEIEPGYMFKKATRNH